MLTYGIELELPDIDTTVELPAELGSYDTQDYTIVNNNGVANDPKKKYVLIGSEINTKPTKTIDEQLQIITNIYKLFSTRTNHKSNLHIHIGVENLASNIDAVKQFQIFINKYEDLVYQFIDPLPIPETLLMAKRMQHVKKSHQYKLPDNTKHLITTAKNHNQLYTALGVSRLSRRAGINLKSLYANGTIEFRHFFGTDNIYEYAGALLWCRHFVQSFLRNKNPFQQFENMKLQLPRMAKWNEHLQIGFEFTNYKVKEKKGEAEYIARLNYMKERGRIEAKHLGSMFG